MNKKILMLTISLLLVAMFVTPIMAKSPKKVPVTIETSDVWYIAPPEVWVSGNVQHGRGFTGGFAHYTITGDGIPDLHGTNSYIGNYNINLENGRGAVLRKIVITFPGGTFQGHVNLRGTFLIVSGGPMAGFPAPIDATGHGVFHGTGDYLGWTLVFTRTGGQFIDPYMLIP